MNIFKRKLLFGAFVLSILVAPSLAWSEPYVVGMEPSFPPWAMVSQGEYKGIGADAIRAMAEQQGFDVEFKVLPWSALIPALKKGQIDIITGAMSATPARAKEIAFTVPWWVVPMELLVKKGSGDNIVTALCCGSNVGAQAQTTDYRWLRERAENGADINIHSYSSPSLAINDLKYGRIDAILMDRSPAITFQEKHPELLRIAGQVNPNPPQVYAMGIKKGNTELLALMNKAVVELYESGKWAEIIHKYIPGIAIPKVPGPLRQDIPYYHKPIPGLAEAD